MVVHRVRPTVLFGVKRYFQETAISEERVVYTQRLTGKDEGISVLCLNRPERKNALGKTLTSQLIEEISRAKENSRLIRVLVIRSLVPGIFCAGADLKERFKMSEEEVPKMSALYRKTFSQIESLPFPVIAALDGHALGGGLEMALACDLRIASSTAKIGLVETGLAIIPGAGGTQRLPRLIGSSKAKELIFTAAILDGNEAEQIGLVNFVTKQSKNDDVAYQKSLEVARKISRNGPLALKAAKEAINRGMEENLVRALEMEGEYVQSLVHTKDRVEGLKAFLEKRQPNYRGE